MHGSVSVDCRGVCRRNGRVRTGRRRLLEHVIYRRVDDARPGDWRQIPFREKIDTAGFDAFGGGSSADFAEEEKFVDVVLDPRMVVFVAIVDRGQFFQTTSK